MPGRRNDFGAGLLTDSLPPPGSDGGLSLQAFAELSARVGRIADGIDEQNGRAAKLWAAVRPIPGIPIPQITTTSGTADYPELLSPRTGFWWFVIQAGALTFTAGSVNLYRQAAVDSQLVGAFPSAGYLTYSSVGLPVMWDQRLIFTASTVTGNVTPNLATVIEVADWAVPAYVM